MRDACKGMTRKKKTLAFPPFSSVFSFVQVVAATAVRAGATMSNNSGSFVHGLVHLLMMRCSRFPGFHSSGTPKRTNILKFDSNHWHPCVA